MVEDVSVGYLLEIPPQVRMGTFSDNCARG